MWKEKYMQKQAQLKPNSKKIQELDERLSDLKSQLSEHKLYSKLNTLEHIKTFTEYHVFAVWDFMSLVKTLQRELTSVAVPWMPKQNTKIARLINEIVLDEETDIDSNGNYVSHFEMYLSAMKNIGAETCTIDSLISSLRSGFSVERAIENPLIPAEARQFMSCTFKVINEKDIHQIASTFAFGRESMIPKMFIGILENIKKSDELDLLIEYFEKHVELDEEKHKHLAQEMVNVLCEENEEKIIEAKLAAIDALESRLKLWDSIYEKL